MTLYCISFYLQEEKIIHKEAVQIIARKVQPWFLDQTNDNYVSLVHYLHFPFS